MPGVSGELAQELDHLKVGANRDAGPMRITIPVDHPDSDRLRKLMEALANKIQRPSGLVIERGKIPNADLILLDELRRLGAPIPAMAPSEDRVAGVAMGAVLAVEELVNREPHRVAGELAELQIKGWENK